MKNELRNLIHKMAVMIRRFEYAIPLNETVIIHNWNMLARSVQINIPQPAPNFVYLKVPQFVQKVQPKLIKRPKKRSMSLEDN